MSNVNFRLTFDCGCLSTCLSTHSATLSAITFLYGPLSAVEVGTSVMPHGLKAFVRVSYPSFQLVFLFQKHSKLHTFS